MSHHLRRQTGLLDRPRLGHRLPHQDPVADRHPARLNTLDAGRDVIGGVAWAQHRGIGRSRSASTTTRGRRPARPGRRHRLLAPVVPALGRPARPPPAAVRATDLNGAPQPEQQRDAVPQGRDRLAQHRRHHQVASLATRLRATDTGDRANPQRRSEGRPTRRNPTAPQHRMPRTTSCTKAAHTRQGVPPCEHPPPERSPPSPSPSPSASPPAARPTPTTGAAARAPRCLVRRARAPRSR